MTNKQVILFLVAASSPVFSPCLQAQPTPTRSDIIWVEPNTPIDDALARGVLFSPLEEGNVAATQGFNPLLQMVAPYPSAIAIDNAGIAESGKNRVGVGLALNDRLTSGDRLHFRGALTDESGNDFWQLSYLMPVGTSDTRVGLSYLQSDYRLGDPFTALGANGGASIATVYVSHPLYRVGNESLYLRGAYEHRSYNDRIDAVGTSRDITVDLWNAGFFGSSRDNFAGGGLNAYYAILEVGDAGYSPAAAAAADQAGHKNAGQYTKGTFGLRRLQRLSERTSLYVSGEGQMVSKNIPAGNLPIGGAGAVRAYPMNEQSGDDGYLITVEGRYQVPGFNVLGATSALTAFYDRGTVDIRHTPIAGDPPNSRTLAGYGVGLFIGKQADFFLRVSVAWQAEGGKATGTDGDKNPRVWMQMAKWF